MAGRGTDIRLGGPDEKERDRVVALGGLYVIGTNRHESRRIDEQLRGRAGRQGDPGSSRFFVSLEDDLVRRYGVEKLVSARHSRFRTGRSKGRWPPRSPGPRDQRAKVEIRRSYATRSGREATAAIGAAAARSSPTIARDGLVDVVSRLAEFHPELTEASRRRSRAGGPQTIDRC
jgi:hypothetical protein